MSLRKLSLLCALIVCQAVDARSQTIPQTTFVPLIVEEGVPFQVVLTGEVRLKENEPVRARVIEPVYAFDREVIPSGAVVIGRITGFAKTGKWKRISRMLGGDFTPVRVPQITFDRLVIAGCETIPIETFVVPATETLVQVDGNKGKSPKDMIKTLKGAVPGSGKGELKKLFWGLAPYHPQSLLAQTPLKIVLLAPLYFGAAVLGSRTLDEIGSPPPPDSIVNARLITPLDSRTVRPGALVEAVLTHPLLSSDKRLIYPVGSKVRGEVLEARAARKRHRNGHLTFRFTTIELPFIGTIPMRAAREIDGGLISMQVAADINNLRINKEGEAWIKDSKGRFFAPAWALVKGYRAMDATADPFEQALLGAYQSKFLKQISGGASGSGFGLPASIAGAMVPPVKIGLGFYGAARSIYTNFLGRGTDIRFPADTLIQIRLQQNSHEEANDQ